MRVSQLNFVALPLRNHPQFAQVGKKSLQMDLVGEDDAQQPVPQDSRCDPIALIAALSLAVSDQANQTATNGFVGDAQAPCNVRGADGATIRVGYKPVLGPLTAFIAAVGI